MAKIIGLPKLSPTMEEGTLVAWTKKEGDAIDVDDLLAEVETDKATMEFRSFDKGVLLKILVKEGETLSPDEPVAIIGNAGDDISSLLDQVKSGSSESSAEAPNKSSSEQVSTKGEDPKAEQQVEENRNASPKQQQVSSVSGRIIASPYVRKIAREQGLDLGRVEGSGPKGRIVKRDIESGVSSTSPSETQQQRRSGQARSEQPRIEKASQMRKTIARRLTESKQNVPHFYLTVEVNAAPMMKLRKLINEELAKVDEKISLNDILLKACGVALQRKPEVNASWMDGTIHYHPNVDISIAVAIEGGLVTPVLRNTDQLGIQEIGLKVRNLAERSKQKVLKPEEMQNGTFSVSNLGMYGIEEFSAVINPPEGAILAVGTAREVPVVEEGKITVGHRMKLTMSCDHRVIDGALGAQWLAILKDLLENPGKMLI